MYLNVAVFVPEGIVLSSDTLAFVRNGDDGYFSESQRTFCLWNRYILSFVGNGYIGGLPYGYYINDFMFKNRQVTFQSVIDFLRCFFEYIKDYPIDKNEAIYCAGYDDNGIDLIPSLLLLERENIIRLNYDESNSQVLYNYHIVGNNLWINKLFLPTIFKDNVIGQEEEFQAASIDFSKYSIPAAVDFAHFLFSLTEQMDAIIQLRTTVNRKITTALITPLGKAYIL